MADEDGTIRGCGTMMLRPGDPPAVEIVVSYNPYRLPIFVRSLQVLGILNIVSSDKDKIIAWFSFRRKTHPGTSLVFDPQDVSEKSGHLNIRLNDHNPGAAALFGPSKAGKARLPVWVQKLTLLERPLLAQSRLSAEFARR